MQERILVSFHRIAEKVADGMPLAVVIPAEFPNFVKGGRPRKLLGGLVTRRQAEIALANTPSSVYEYPCDKDADGDPFDPDEGSE
jgi:hypothetical protein